MAARVAVVGAGPNGLSIAAHLNARGLQPLVFGKTMQFWRDSMPAGMKLKSDGFASNFSEPSGRFTLKTFCEAHRLPYGDMNAPIPLETYIAYGEAFQQRFAPQVDDRFVKNITRKGEGFSLELEDGTAVEAGQVVIATGLGAFANIPAPLTHISAERLSHSSAVSDCARFAGKRVLVVGAGASATDVAASMVKAGAEVFLVCRDRTLEYIDGGKTRSWWRRLLAPDTSVGPGWKRVFITKFPNLFALAPDWLRVYIVDNMLGPSPAWFVRPDIEGRIRVLPAREILGARENANGVDVELGRVGAQIEYFRADHIVVGTGYQADIHRLPMLSPELLGEITLIEGSPRLSATFESSVSGLYFTGALAAYTFGPMLRFVCGAEFAARRIAAALDLRALTHSPTAPVAPTIIRLARP